LEDGERLELEKDINAALIDHNYTRVAEPVGSEVELVDTEAHSELLNNNLGVQIAEHDPDLDPSAFALVAARGSAELMIDPVFLGWRR